MFVDGLTMQRAMSLSARYSSSELSVPAQEGLTTSSVITTWLFYRVKPFEPGFCGHKTTVRYGNQIWTDNDGVYKEESNWSQTNSPLSFQCQHLSFEDSSKTFRLFQSWHWFPSWPLESLLVPWVVPCLLAASRKHPQSRRTSTTSSRLPSTTKTMKVANLTGTYITLVNLNNTDSHSQYMP